MALAFVSSSGNIVTGVNTSTTTCTVTAPTGVPGTEPASYDFAGITNTTERVIIFLFSGVDTTTPLYTAPAFTDGAASTSWVAPSVAWATGTVLVCGWNRNAASSTLSTPAGMTVPTAGKQPTSGNVAEQLAYQAFTSGATSGTRTATHGTSASYSSMSTVVNPSAGTGAQLLVAYHSVNPDAAGSLAAMTAPSGWTQSGAFDAATSRTKVWTKLLLPATNYTQTITDTVGAADSRTQVAGAVQAITDTVGAADSTAVVTARTLTDTAGASDNAAQVLTAAQAVTDAAGTADSTAIVETFVATLTDTAGATDSRTQASVAAQTVTDSAASTDAVATTSAIAAQIGDAAGAVDSTAQSAAYAQTVTDAASATDSSSAAEAFALAVTDAAGTADTTAQAGTLARNVDDNAGAVDATVVQAAGAVQVTVTDTAGTADTAAQAGSSARSTSDAVGASDDVAVQAAGAVQVTVTDSVGAMDGVASARIIRLALVDVVAAGDAVVTDQSSAGATRPGAFFAFLGM